MTTLSRPDYILTDTPHDILTDPAYADCIGKKVTIQAKYVTEAIAWIGSPIPDDPRSGVLLLTGKPVLVVNASIIFVSGKGRISVTLDD